MKQLACLTVVVCLIFLFGCQNPLKFGATILPGISGSEIFNRDNLAPGGIYEVGYQNGNLQSTQIDLQWHTCLDDNFLAYKLFRNNQLIRTIVHAYENSCIDSVLTQNTSYDYRIVFLLTNGMAVQDTIRLKTPRFTAPDHLSYTYLNSTSATITWSDTAESATWYRLERLLGDSQTPLVREVTDNYYVETNLIPGALYHYRVKAINDYEETEYSDWEHFNFAYIDAAPTLTAAVQLSPTQDVQLTWTDNSTIENNFRVHRAVSPGNIFHPIVLLPGNTTQWTDTSAKETGLTYSYRVSMLKDEIENLSNTLSVMITESQFEFFDFEFSDGGFTRNNPYGWQWGSPSNVSPYAGSNVMGCPLTGYYNYNADDQLYSPLVQLPENSTLQFYHTYDLESSWDGGNVKISTDYGYTWTLLYPEGGYPYNYIQSSGEPGYSGHHNYWSLASYDVTAYVGLNVMFCWTLNSDSSGNYYGWQIDDVRIGNGSSKSASKPEVACTK